MTDLPFDFKPPHAYQSKALISQNTPVDKVAVQTPIPPNLKSSKPTGTQVPRNILNVPHQSLQIESLLSGIGQRR